MLHPALLFKQSGKCTKNAAPSLRRECKNVWQRRRRIVRGHYGKRKKKVVSALSKWDEDDKYIKESKAKFAAANKEFIRYRKAQCAFGSSLSGGGVGGVREMGRLGCVTELNNRRAQQLLDAVSTVRAR